MDQSQSDGVGAGSRSSDSRSSGSRSSGSRLESECEAGGPQGPAFRSDRRQVLRGLGAACLSLPALAAPGIFPGSRVAAAADPGDRRSGDRDDAAGPLQGVRYCLNTSTVRGHNLTLTEQIELAAEAGYDGIELWIRDIEKHLSGGGQLAEVKRLLDDRKLVVESAIGFPAWIVDDPQRRRQALEQAKREMEWVGALGGTRIAAPPAGATRESVDLFRAAERYRTLVELGQQTGVRPQLELWGFSQTLSRLGELMLVATECAHPATLLLPDVYHIYRGGSDFGGLKMIAAERIEVFHINDYPAEPGRETIRDADRVYPGDGTAPLTDILRGLGTAGFRGVLSLELFNPRYWEQPAAQVARDGLARMRAAVERAQQARS